ncbi:MAG: tetratricopeptide repeat protein [Propionibacteriaceae bacterium]|nr:tetratricopeptide repeat protein [Propionibacteriaceae bacterium]
MSHRHNESDAVPAESTPLGGNSAEFSADATPDPGEDLQGDDLHARVREFLDTAPPDLTQWASATAAQLGDTSPKAPLPARPRRRVPTALIVLLVVPLVIWGVWRIGVPPESEQVAAMPSMPAEHSAPPLDTDAVAEMEARVEADPADTEAMSELGRLHLVSGDFKQAAQWQQRILAEHPDDVDARLALGVALFDQGELDLAQVQWERASELDPAKAEPHYNLGFLHLSADPPDMDQVRVHWEKVLELDPESSMAKTISTHMGGLEGLEPTPKDEP